MEVVSHLWMEDGRLLILAVGLCRIKVHAEQTWGTGSVLGGYAVLDMPAAVGIFGRMMTSACASWPAMRLHQSPLSVLRVQCLEVHVFMLCQL